jgi:hypothetical protein
MKMLCIYLDFSDLSSNIALAIVANNFPCFINSKPEGYSGMAEVSIQCRVEDLPTIENILAPFI